MTPDYKALRAQIEAFASHHKEGASPEEQKETDDTINNMKNGVYEPLSDDYKASLIASLYDFQATALERLFHLSFAACQVGEDGIPGVTDIWFIPEVIGHTMSLIGGEDTAAFVERHRNSDAYKRQQEEKRMTLEDEAEKIAEAEAAGFKVTPIVVGVAGDGTSTLYTREEAAEKLNGPLH